MTETTEHAEWITQPCGKCRLWVGRGFVEDDVDPTCEDHREFTCAICGRSADKTTITHGVIGSKSHKPEEG